MSALFPALFATRALTLLSHPSDLRFKISTKKQSQWIVNRLGEYKQNNASSAAEKPTRPFQAEEFVHSHGEVLLVSATLLRHGRQRLTPHRLTGAPAHVTTAGSPTCWKAGAGPTDGKRHGLALWNGDRGRRAGSADLAQRQADGNGQAEPNRCVAVLPSAVNITDYHSACLE